MDEFVFVTTLRVRYSETDQMGVVYNANYLVWFEVARTEFCRKFGAPYNEWEKKGTFLPVVEARCRYKAPARYDEAIGLWCRAVDVKPHSITFQYRVVNEMDVLLAEGFTRHGICDGEGKLYRRNNPLSEWLEELIGQTTEK